ncbi:two-component system, NtrC family, nitrogen regulation sensor histidine kinase GlnL [Sulfurivirga caldicuralii]|uniref:histidine kinase n=1 Tax=Sulfurivirga caldicuralii TaxID=364032 RepID=A0A1N6ER07_9GAMM|nr:nitrogen regulation protein NR(II) [Sulfurivirga caldicuralii]SIN85438.1 two-component system, NtrC family, nitrogen regulation sensor histidine kinase GlnL [Sulfurivirga caldicuralii]
MYKIPPQVAQELLGGLMTAVMWFDADQKLQWMNLSASELFFCGLNKARGRPFSWFFPKTDIDWKACEHMRMTLHEQVLERDDGQQLEGRLVIASYDIQGENGWLVEVNETLRERRILEEEERWHQYEAGTQLVKTLAHEIKNPLAGIYGATQLLKPQLPDTRQAHKALSVIRDEVKRLQNLVDRMLGPRKLPELAPHNIHDVLGYVLEVLEGERPANISIRLDYDPSIPEFAMDFEQLVQAFINLVRNAFQAMHAHGGVLTLRTRVEHRFTLGQKLLPQVVVVEVIDEGEGIPPELADAIFYPMVTSKPDGTGLGLPVSQAVVRQHGGLITTESEPGHTCFSVILPLPREREAHDA